MIHKGGKRVLYLKILDTVNNVFGKIAGAMLAGMVICITLQIFARMIIPLVDFQINLSWTEELARYLMIWMIFVGGALAARKGRLIAIETLVQTLPALPGKILKFSAHTISITFYIAILFIGLEWVSFGGSETAPATKIPMSFVYASMVVGAFLMTVNTIGFLIEIILGKKDIRFSDLEEI
jgi:TRAP-type transport system small permease protein